MKIIYNTKNYKGAKALLFGLKDLSTYENEISLEELNKYKDKEIYLALDKNMFNEDLPKLEESLKEIDKLNIKGILFYDLAVLHISKRLNLKTPLIWNQNFLVTNYKTCNFYEKQNIKGAVISGEITIEEIEQLAKNTKIDLYINAFGYQLMAISKRKLITNYFNHTKEKNQEKVHKMIEKENSYPIIENKTCTKIYTKEVLNGIKYLNRLKQAGIKDISIHDLRHTFITNCKNAGIPEHIVQSWVGHQIGSKVTSSIYTHITEDSNLLNINKLNSSFFYSNSTHK